MTIVVGFGPESQGHAGLALASRLAGVTGEEIVLCCVVHDAFASAGLRDFDGVDDDWRRALREMGREALAEAHARIPEDLAVTEVLRTGRSVPQTLEVEATSRQASLLVVGSARGVIGRVALGSTSDRLVHSSRVPVALAPRGYPAGDQALERIVLAVDPSDPATSLGAQASALSRRLSATVEIVTFAVRGSSRSALAVFAAGEAYAQWRDQVDAAQRTIAAQVTGAAAETPVTTRSVVEGERWTDAVGGFAWRPGDLLMLGSSSSTGLARVFLGSTATRILRHAPVPVVVVPRSARDAEG